jgi:preprotein translocase subunit SecD
VLVRKPAELTGSSIKSAFEVQGNLGKPEIVFTLTPAGSETFAAMTRENVGRHLAPVYELFQACFGGS